MAIRCSALIGIVLSATLPYIIAAVVVLIGVGIAFTYHIVIRKIGRLRLRKNFIAEVKASFDRKENAPRIDQRRENEVVQVYGPHEATEEEARIAIEMYAQEFEARKRRYETTQEDCDKRIRKLLPELEKTWLSSPDREIVLTLSNPWEKRVKALASFLNRNLPKKDKRNILMTEIVLPSVNTEHISFMDQDIIPDVLRSLFQKFPESAGYREILFTSFILDDDARQKLRDGEDINLV